LDVDEFFPLEELLDIFDPGLEGQIL
jgi:hypothetical protein